MTAEELIARPDLEPCELIDGVVVPVMPSFRREGRIGARLGARLNQWIEAGNRGHGFLGNVGIHIRRDPNTVRGADFIYASHERYAQQGSSEYLDIAPELVAEVVGPEEGWCDLMAKLDDYFSIGVDRVWLVDPKGSRIFVYRSLTDVQQLGLGDTLTDDDLLPGFRLSLSELFRS